MKAHYYVFKLIIWVGVALSALWAIITYFSGVSEATTWPQVGAIAAQSLAIAAIPYIFARAFDEIKAACEAGAIDGLKKL